MDTLSILVSVCLLYVIVLFAVAALADQLAAAGMARWLRSPVVYTLSLSIYCTGWTFYGAVGYAARSGLEFLTIYLGPTLVMIGWWWGLRKLVRIMMVAAVTASQAAAPVRAEGEPCPTQGHNRLELGSGVAPQR